MGRIERGWALTKESWQVLQRDRSLLVFPILSTIFAILATIAIWVPVVITTGLFINNESVDNRVLYGLSAVMAYIWTFIAIFFNVALAACAVRSLRGEDTTVGEGLTAAARRIGPILGWTLVATTVGLILNALEQRLPLAGRIAAWLTGAAWAIATFFVVPVLALEGHGPWRSLKRSAAIVKARWGEGATGAATIGVVTFVATFVIVLVGAFGGALVMAMTNEQLLAGAIWAITIVGVVVVAIISSALNQIFRVAVYEYAVTGGTPSGFDSALLQTAFK
jgi:hypothetical protein